MVDINVLDKTLNFTRNDYGLLRLTEDDNPHFTKEENEYLKPSAWHLEKEGYLRPNGINGQYSLTMDGIMALNARFLFMYKNRPYKRMQVIEGWKNAWLVVKVVALALNGLALLVLAMLTFFFKN